MRSFIIYVLPFKLELGSIALLKLFSAFFLKHTEHRPLFQKQWVYDPQKSLFYILYIYQNLHHQYFQGPFKTWEQFFTGFNICLSHIFAELHPSPLILWTIFSLHISLMSISFQYCKMMVKVDHLFENRISPSASSKSCTYFFIGKKFFQIIKLRESSRSVPLDKKP